MTLGFGNKFPKHRRIFNLEKSMEDCIFCKVVKREIPSQIVYEDDDVLAFKDINPGAPVHVVAVPKKHISGVMDIMVEDEQLVGHIILVLRDIAVKTGISDSGFRIVVNSGADAGQSVHHIHFHLLGGRSMDWPPG